MIRRLALAALLVLCATALLAMNFDRLLLFHFNPERVSPAEAGEPRLREVTHLGLVLWVASPGPGKPVIFYLPGNAGNLANRAGRFRRFLDRGYGLVAMAYPGSSGSVGSQSAEEIQRLADALYRDVVWLAQGKAGPGAEAAGVPVVLYGESLGTGVAVALAAGLEADPSGQIALPAALVLEAPYTSISDVARHLYPSLAPIADRLPQRWPTKRDIAHVHAPLLILHGGQDDFIPPAMGRTLIARSPATIRQLHIEPGAGHGNVWQPAAISALFRFLEAL